LIKKIVLPLAVVFVLTACHQSIPSEYYADETESETVEFSETGESSETGDTSETGEPAPEPVFPVNAEAERFYSLLTENKDVWLRDVVYGCTLLDVDFDGVPEVVTSGETNDEDGLRYYKINGEKLEYFTELVEKDGGYYGGVMALYTDENGNRSWVIEHSVRTDDDTSEYRLSLFDFTGAEPTEFVKFGELSVYDPDTSEYSYKLFLDGKEFTEKNLTKEQLDGYDELMAHWQMAGNYKYPENPTEAYWTLSEMEFEDELVPTMYCIGSWQYAYGPGWSDVDQDEFERRCAELANAYVTNDEEYLMYGHTFSAAIAKPVIYLYPTEPTDVSVRVTFPKGGDFTCTYPEYKDGWDVTAYPDGRVINKADGLEYSYLYWEGEGFADWDFSRGFVVAGKDTAAFLREKLSFLGLTPREYNEFIVYWLPLMQNNAYNLITFQTEKYEASAKLEVSPKPDSVLRVFMAYKPLDEAIKIPEQELSAFERTGFAVIEWGGTTVN